MYTGNYTLDDWILFRTWVTTCNETKALQAKFTLADHLRKGMTARGNENGPDSLWTYNGRIVGGWELVGLNGDRAVWKWADDWKEVVSINWWSLEITVRKELEKRGFFAPAAAPSDSVEKGGAQ